MFPWGPMSTKKPPEHCQEECGKDQESKHMQANKQEPTQSDDKPFPNQVQNQDKMRIDPQHKLLTWDCKMHSFIQFHPFIKPKYI